jgi:hypothetical protein
VTRWLRRLLERVWPQQGRHHADPWPDPEADWSARLIADISADNNPEATP